MAKESTFSLFMSTVLYIASAITAAVLFAMHRHNLGSDTPSYNIPQHFRRCQSVDSKLDCLRLRRDILEPIISEGIGQGLDAAGNVSLLLVILILDVLYA